MKKLLAAACVATIAAGALQSCCGKGDCSTGAFVNDSTVSTMMVDSISMAQGEYIGNAVLSNYPMIEAQTHASKENIIKGIQIVLGTNADRGTEIGIQFGLQMLNEMRQLESMGIKVNRSLMLENFKKAFLGDSIDQDDAQRTYAMYQGLVNRVQEERTAREEARIAAGAEAQKNVADGVACLAAARQADADVKTTESGLGYKIVAAGEGKSVADAHRLKLKYTEKTVDGTVLNETPAEGRTTYLSNLTPGFAEGLKMLSEGGQAVFYVPGELAYGVKGVQARNIGPNMMIIYEVEVLGAE